VFPFLQTSWMLVRCCRVPSRQVWIP
jgi:hypothetical protein